MLSIKEIRAMFSPIHSRLPAGAYIVLIAIFVINPAVGEINKCKSPDGSITFTDGTCRPPAVLLTPQTITLDSKDSTPGQEMYCALLWWSQRSQIYGNDGDVDNGRQAFHTVRQFKDYDRTGKIEYRIFDVNRCAKFGYRKALSLHDYARNEWTSRQTWCNIVRRGDFNRAAKEISFMTPAEVNKLYENKIAPVPNEKFAELGRLCDAFLAAKSEVNLASQLQPKAALAEREYLEFLKRTPARSASGVLSPATAPSSEPRYRVNK